MIVMSKQLCRHCVINCPDSHEAASRYNKSSKKLIQRNISPVSTFQPTHATQRIVAYTQDPCALRLRRVLDSVALRTCSLRGLEIGL